MQVNITQNKQNILLHRKEVLGKLVFEGATPSNNELKEALAKENKVGADLIVIKGIHTNFSGHEAAFEASVYDTAEAKRKTEKMPPHEKKKAAEAKKAAAGGQ